MLKKIFQALLVLVCMYVTSCNLLLVAVRNVPTFFETPRTVKNKITDPIKPNVRLSALWIGHATVLIQMDDKVIITDPFLTETAGEFARRTVEPGIEIKNLPQCDIILISHSHFDHLSLGSLELLEGKGHKNSSLIFPNGLENYIPDYDMNLVKMKNDNGFENNIAGETRIINGIKVTSVYSQHWAGRYGLDGYLWGDKAFTGYILEYKGMSVYFAGDTGYDSLKFRKIGEMFKIDLALIPIGPCAECNQCGTYNHVFPVDAYELYKDVNPKWMIPIHYGTLHFAQADPMEPRRVFEELVNKNKEQDNIYILNIGEQKILMEK